MYRSKVIASFLFVVLVTLLLPTKLWAEQAMIEEVIVTARRQAESFQDVPVTVAVFTEEDLDRYNINTITDAAKMIPNFSVSHGESGNGSQIYLRGVGSSSISAAFDQSVAINIDGVVVNRGRMIHNAYMDMGQLEVLKGPQSLYFGKSATAGVVSISTNDPGDEFEVQAMVGMETEHEGTYTEFVISGPVTDTFGARLAIGTSEYDEMYKNLSPGVGKPWRGEESTDARLTLVWEPSDTFKARLKYSYSEYENDGANGHVEELCPDGTVQPSTALGLIFPGVDDCKLNGNTSIADLLPPLVAGNPLANGGVPYLEQETDLVSLQLDWVINDSLSLTSVTGLVDLQHVEFDVYDYSAGIFGGGHENSYESLSQEFRLASDFDGKFNFQAGVYIQDIEQEFHAYQYAANIGLVAPDPITGNGYDYDKHHFTDTDVMSIFVAGYWDITENVEVTAGVRYTDEEKEGYITVPYVHLFLQALFAAPPRIDGLKFDDTNTSPEIAVNWNYSDSISFFAAYKEGFKSGGFDTSALPTATLNEANPEFPGFLLFDSEEAEGFEVGMKANLLNNSMRFNATVFSYEYTDLQVQLFDSAAIQYSTFNASQLQTNGAELDMLWITDVEGLTVRAALALTDAEYTDDFINPDGQNLDGYPRERSADIAGFAGFTYDWSIGSNLRMDFSLDARYNDGYPLMATHNPYEQDSFWLTDAAIRLYSDDDKWEVAFIARNLGDEIIAYTSGNRPGACVQADTTNPDPTLWCKQFTQPVLNIEQDQNMNTSLGVQYFVQAKVKF